MPKKQVPVQISTDDTNLFSMPPVRFKQAPLAVDLVCHARDCRSTSISFSQQIIWFEVGILWDASKIDVHHVVTIVVHPLPCRRYFRLFMRHTAEAATIPYVGIPKRTP